MATRTAVAIIGSGSSGLSAAKAAIEEGLSPSVFEQNAELGGIWQAGEGGKVWHGLRTNLSKYTCAFSDFPWPAHAADFPSAAQMACYLRSYAVAFGLISCIRFSTQVVSVQQCPIGWRVLWLGPEGAGEAVFQRVIVASGFFARPAAAPAAAHALVHQANVLHSYMYREKESFAGLEVLVVGAAFSGAEIASEIAHTASSVTVVASEGTPLWYLPRVVRGRPLDLLMYSRARSESGRTHAEMHAWLQTLGATLKGRPTPHPDQPPHVSISDDFCRLVNEGAVGVIVSRLVAVKGDVAVFADGTRRSFDKIVLATGYRSAFPFLAAVVLERLEFNGDDGLVPIILHKCVWPPVDLAGLAFVGMYRGPYLGVLELQARWVCGVFSGRLPAPLPTEVAAGMEAERRIRRASPRPQFPHGDYVAMADDLAREVGAFPDAILKDGLHPLHQQLYHGALLPFHYRLVGTGAKPSIAEAAIDECYAQHPPMLPSPL